MERLVNIFKEYGDLQWKPNGGLDQGSVREIRDTIREIFRDDSLSVDYCGEGEFYCNCDTFIVSSLNSGTYKIEQWETF